MTRSLRTLTYFYKRRYTFGILVFRGTFLLANSKNHDLWPGPTLFRVKSDKSDWFVSIHCVYKVIQKGNLTGPIRKSRFLVLTKRSAASGDENALFFGETKRQPEIRLRSHNVFLRRGRLLKTFVSLLSWC